MAFFNYPFHVTKDTAAVASEVQTNFDEVLAWILSNLIQKDGTVAMTGPLVLAPGDPGAPAHAANKAYVDSMIPIGVVWEYAGTSLPADWLWCNGDTYTNTSQVRLSAAIGRTYTAAGVPDTSFQVPDMRKRSPVGYDATEAAKYGLGVKGGQRDSELRAHAHTVPIHGHTAGSGVDDREHTHGISFMSGASDRSLAHQHYMQHTHPGTGFNSQTGYFNRGLHNAGGWGGGLDSGAMGGAHHTPPTGYADRDWTGAEGAPDHLHAINGATQGRSTGHYHAITVNNAAAFSTTTDGAGTTLTDKNLPPYIVLNYIIYAGPA